jgi:hypothetical protein
VPLLALRTLALAGPTCCRKLIVVVLNALERSTGVTNDMLTAEQILAKLYELRKDYADDPQDLNYLALHHAFLFASYQMDAFRKYLQEAQKSGNNKD